MPAHETFPCACAFAKAVDDSNPEHFPRVGIADNVLYRGHWIIRHSQSGREAIIARSNEPPLHAEVAACCLNYFQRIPSHA
ncbi:hypothetical protein EDC90_103310 [Martelella mediterranea]|uniref:Uncharacterized protein n=1 Tax=Martelella mediterranea TaxID=293089 RepID=A0A4R3NR06_9HYPH|nr:hypothetical protein EDC90_103310 [Martelella mediterranea]